MKTSKQQHEMMSKINRDITSEMYQKQIELTAELCGYPPSIRPDYKEVIESILKSPRLNDHEKIVAKVWLTVTEYSQNILSDVIGKYMKLYEQFTNNSIVK